MSKPNHMEQYKLETLRANYDVFKNSHHWQIKFTLTDTVQRNIPQSTIILPHSWDSKMIYNFIVNMEKSL